MSIVVALMRIIHTFARVTWVGTAFFFVLLLEPTVEAAGAEGGWFMQRLTRTHLALTLSTASALVAISGVMMYWIMSSSLQLAWISNPRRVALTFGSLAGILAFAIGLAIQGPAAGRMAAIQKEMQTVGGPPNATQMAELRA